MTLIRRQLRAFQWAQDEHRTLSLSPLKGGGLKNAIVVPRFPLPRFPLPRFQRPPSRLLSLILHGWGQKLQNLARLLTPVIFEALWFQNRTTYRKSKTWIASVDDSSIHYFEKYAIYSLIFAKGKKCKLWHLTGSGFKTTAYQECSQTSLWNAFDVPISPTKCDTFRSTHLWELVLAKKRAEKMCSVINNLAAECWISLQFGVRVDAMWVPERRGIVKIHFPSNLR